MKESTPDQVTSVKPKKQNIALTAEMTPTPMVSGHKKQNIALMTGMTSSSMVSEHKSKILLLRRR